MAQQTWNEDDGRLHSPSRRRYQKLGNLQPHTAERDLLVVLASVRSPSWTARHQNRYLPLRADAMRPVRLPGAAA